MRTLLVVLSLFAASAASADVLIHTTDGRTLRVAVDPSEVASIEMVRNEKTATPPATPAPQKLQVQGTWRMLTSADNGNCNGSSVIVRQAASGQITSMEGIVSCEKGVATGRWVADNIRWANENTVAFSYRYVTKSVDRLRDGTSSMVFTSSTTAKQPDGPGTWKKE